MINLVKQICQFKEATTSPQKNLKESFFGILKVYIHNHNIEIFKQVSNYTTCL
jgi:hypothetical protein